MGNGNHRLRIRVTGVVQGVGFRPFVARLAAQLGLAGFVRNTTGAVEIEVEGAPAALTSFVPRLTAEAPLVATIEHVDRQAIEPLGDTAFRIAASERAETSGVGLPPDLAICADCRREMDDPRDRRFRYPFLNCTVCGPRYSIADALPYDRPLTSMRHFPLCADCAREYDDPSDRRYHAQPIACPACGPQLAFDGDTGRALEQACAALGAGQIGAVRGIGGFHLAANARDLAAVARLRERKARGTQPFAMMVRDVATAREFVTVDEQAARLLGSTAAPIVLLPQRDGHPVGQALAPGNGYLGVILPYSPLHRLLLDSTAGLDALVMTSANPHGEPIVTGNHDARVRLSGLADFFLTHDREIVAAADDSVVRLHRGRALALRRGRGYAPLGFTLPVESFQSQAPALAMGAELKAALGLSQGTHAWLGPHVGDMENLATLEAFDRTLQHLCRLYRVHPERVLHDAHPGYLSTQWALQRGVPALAIQHHRAHVAAVLAEHGIPPSVPVAAAVFDGTGYGDDGAIWGGEFFRGPVAQLQRCRHLPYVVLPGGDASAKRPALSAIAHLAAAGIDWRDTAAGRSLTPSEAALAARQLERQIHCHPTSSMGRLFDAAASLLGIRHRVTYEAQAAIEMEALAAPHPAEPYGAALWQLPELWAELLADRAGAGRQARRFHSTVALWTIHTLLELASGISTIVLSGGVFQNVLLLEEVSVALEKRGFRVLVPRFLPANDGGLALGQLYLGALTP
ncbi:MAG: carbamoyltransferase HypF [Bryobacteraceae bacterium]|nr:carbamoyltransferase HypF [Bryobacteraceae bacterium]